MRQKKKKMLKSHFDMKDLGKANFILGMKITKTCDGIFLNLSHYVEKILRKYNFHYHKSVATTFDSSVHLFVGIIMMRLSIKRIMLASLVVCVMLLIVLDLTLHMQ